MTNSENSNPYNFVNIIQQGNTMPFLTTLIVALPTTPTWSLRVALIMIACNLIAIALGYYAIQKRGLGPALPVPLPAIFTNFGVPEFLATVSFGHLLGAGVILGLGSTGSL